MTYFQCTGGACPTNCCNHDWQVAVDEQAYERLQHILNPTPGGALLLKRAVEMGGPLLGGKPPFAHIRHGENGQCPFQDAAGLCSLHAEHGAEILPDACAVFPRAAIQVGNRLEMGGRLACPEVARLALLQDGAVELLELDDRWVRSIPGKTVALDNRADVYRWAFDDVRNTILQTLGHAELPFGVRVALLADLAERLRPFFHRDTVEFQGPRRELSERRLARELTVNTDPALMAALQQELRGLAVPLPPLVQVLATLLDQRLRMRSNAGFAELVHAILDSYGGVVAAPDGRSRQLCSGETAAARYQERGLRMQELYGPMLERFQGNWAQLYWMQEPYTDSPSLLDHLCRKLIRLGMVRMMLLGHPRVVPVLEQRQQGQEPVVAQAMVDVAFQWARAYEHHPNVLKVMFDALEAQSANTFGRAICLTRLF
jgi:lysine-N-methylase